MKIRYLITYLFIICSLCLNTVVFGYQEIDSTAGKVILGLDKEKTLKKFGIPESAGERIWRYGGNQPFFVYFSGNPLIAIYLYPQVAEVNLGAPLELKAYGYFSDSKIKDITSQVEILVDKPLYFNFTKAGIATPLRAGRYQILVRYDKVFSNPCQIIVKEPSDKEEPDDRKEICLGINLIPYSPVVNPNTRLVFKAWGTFLNKEESIYYLKDISKEAEWFVKKDTGTSEINDNMLQLGSRTGRLSVFCRYEGVESFPQEVRIVNTPITDKQVLKHITLLPEFVFLSVEKSQPFRVFGTHTNNDARELGYRVKWRPSNKDMLAKSGQRGEFIALIEGICDLTAELDGVESAPAKIVVNPKSSASSQAAVMKQAKKKEEDVKKESPKTPEEVLKDIKEDAENLSKDLLKEGRKLKAIRIEPESFKIPLGGTALASAWGVYSDKSEEDLTATGEWEVSDKKIIGVAKGRISAYLPGEASLYLKFKGVTSPLAKVTVEGPKLISIIATPANSKISIRQKVKLKAEGYFSDNSRKDITALVSWGITHTRILKIDGKSVAHPLRLGKTQVYAQYLQIKSLPVNISVIFTWDSLFDMFLNFLWLLLFGAIIMFVALYIITKNKQNKLKTLLEKDPRRFAIKLYENAKEVLDIFDFRQKEILPPLAYASLVDLRYSLRFYYYSVLGLNKKTTPEEVKKQYRELALRYHPDKVTPGNEEKAAERFKEINEAYLALANPKSNRVFFSFTEKFEEAKYSRHAFERGEALSMLSEYNYFIRILLSHYDKPDMFFKYCLSLCRINPLYI